MKILWVCNFMLPVIAEQLNQKSTNKEGWLAGLSEKLMNSEMAKEISLSVCFPLSPKEMPLEGNLRAGKYQKEIFYYSYPEDSTHLEQDQPDTVQRMVEILKKEKPDVIHIFGTEYPHALATLKAAQQLSLDNRILVGIQGFMREYTKSYYADLPQRVVKRVTFRDWLKKDSIPEQKEKFAKRAEMEEELLKNVIHITGRTDFDYQTTKIRKENPPAKYHFMNETLRSNFYDSNWSYEDCEPYTIFCSQGNYPIKGVHKALLAVGELKEEFPQIKLVIAGDKITAYETLKDKIKISSYGKYLLELVKKYKLKDQVIFTGSLNAEAMKEQYLKSHIFLSCSAIENSPNSVGEAMLLGMPVISSDVGGVRSMMNSEEGYFYHFEDVNGLKECMREIFQNTDSAISKGRAAQQKARKTHDGEANFQRLLEIYQSIVAEWRFL